MSTCPLRHLNPPRLLAALLGAVVVATAGPTRAAPNLDPTFGDFGRVLTTNGGGALFAGYALVRQPDGKLVISGNFDEDFGLARYDEGGTLDPSFGTGGIVTTDFGNDADATALALQSDGMIVAVGQAANGTGTEFALARYDATGALDPTFGLGGRVRTPIGASSFALDVVVQPDGRIVAAGTADDGFAAARYLSDGSLDPSFGTAGVVTTMFAGLEVYAYATVLQPDGAIVVAGSIEDEDAGTAEFGLVRYDANGVLDPSFGETGLASSNFGSGFANARSMLRQPDGSFVVVGALGVGNDIDFALMRFDAAGALDSSFGSGGLALGGFPVGGGSNTIALGVEVRSQSDGKLVAAGLSHPPGSGTSFALARFDADGAPDTAFGAGGRLLTSFPGTSDSVAYAMIVTPDDELVLGGYVASTAGGLLDGIALARYGRPCAAAPLAGCRATAAPGDATLKLGGGKLAWKWTAAATTIADFGDPVTVPQHDYVACLYDESGPPALVAAMSAPAAVPCGSKGCWKVSGKGFLFRRKGGTPDGTQSLKLAAVKNGLAKFALGAKGENLALPTLPFSEPVALRMQLQAGNGVCWEASFSAAGVKRNTGTFFGARSD